MERSEIDNYDKIQEKDKTGFTLFSGSKLYLGVEFRTFLIFDIKIGIGVTLSYN